MFRFSSDPVKRLQQLRTIARHPADARRLRRWVTAGVPIHPWPFGMPCSAAPHVVILGVSPGSSPRPEYKDFCTEGQSSTPPTIGAPHGGFFYPVPYWDKARDLCVSLVRRDAPGLNEHEAVALSAHLNLGTGQYGVASERAIDDQIIQWVPQLLGARFPAKLLVCFGLNGLLGNAKYNDLWKRAGGLRLDWQRPDDTESFERYTFRLWHAKRQDGSTMAVLMWPNHPSRHPFGGGPDSGMWQKAKRRAGALLKRHGY